MWTRRPWRSEARREPQGTAPLAAGLLHCRTFTLIELLVVVAIIAVLISILLPSLSAAREQTRAVVCGQHLRQFGNALQTYVAENADWIPGRNTSGVGLIAKRMLWGQDIGVIYQSRLPVQPFDWMTPILAYELELPAERAERFKFLFEHFRCPSQLYTSVVWDGSSAPDLARFYERAPWPAVSYLMPVHFQYVGHNQAGRIVGYYEHQSVSPPIYALAAPPGWEVRVDDYLPLLSRVGTPARKIFAADGTRYLDVTQLLDHDVSVLPDYFGAFASSGAWWSGSTAYGVKRGTQNWSGTAVSAGSKSDGQNLVLSYRHGRQQGVASGDAHDNKGMLNAVFFDGHVERLADRPSREAHLWYPSGTVIQTPSEGMTDLPSGYVIP